jgi:hypothetical protein
MPHCGKRFACAAKPSMVTANPPLGEWNKVLSGPAIVAGAQNKDRPAARFVLAHWTVLP